MARNGRAAAAVPASHPPLPRCPARAPARARTRARSGGDDSSSRTSPRCCASGVERPARLMRIIYESAEDPYLLGHCMRLATQVRAARATALWHAAPAPPPTPTPTPLSCQGTSHFSTFAAMMIWGATGGAGVQASARPLPCTGWAGCYTPTLPPPHRRTFAGHGVPGRAAHRGGRAADGLPPRRPQRDEPRHTGRAALALHDDALPRGSVGPGAHGRAREAPWRSWARAI